MENMEIFIPERILLASDQEVMDLLMNDSSYWNEVDSFLNPIENVEVEESKDKYDSSNYYWDYYYTMIQEDNQILEDDINIHFSKRNNRKFINNNKFRNKIRDKRILWKKGIRFILNSARDCRGRKNTFDSSILSMDLIKTTQVEGYKETLLYKEPFLCSFPNFNTYNQQNTCTRVVFIADHALNGYYPKQLALVDYYDRETAYSIDSNYIVLHKCPHLNFYEKGYVAAKLPEELQVSNTSFYYNGKRKFLGKVVVDDRFCNNQHLYNRSNGSWYYHDKLRLKDQLDRIQCKKEIYTALLDFELKDMYEYEEVMFDFYNEDQYVYAYDYEKYDFVVDTHKEPEQYWNEEYTLRYMYTDHPNIQIQETYDYDEDYFDFDALDDPDNFKDPYDDRFEDNFWDED